MKFKQLLLFSCALLISVSASAFELGKKNATIWHTKESKAQAEVLQKYLGKVFGKKYTLKLYSKGEHLPGLFVGIPQKDAKLNVDMDRDFTVIHSEKDKVYILFTIRLEFIYLILGFFQCALSRSLGILTAL